MVLRKIITAGFFSLALLFSLSLTGIAAAQIVIGYAAPSLDGGQKQIFDGFRVPAEAKAGRLYLLRQEEMLKSKSMTLMTL